MLDTYPLTLEGQTAKITDALKGGEDSHYFIGEAYNYIVANKLAEKAGHKNARAYLVHLFKEELSQATLNRCGAVAQNFSQADSERFGTSKLNELLAYMARVDPNHGPIDPSKVSVQVPHKDKHTHQEQMVTKLFSDCSKAELVAANHHLKQPPSNVPPEEAALFQKYQDAVSQHVGEHIVLKLGAKNGVSRISLDGIPLSLVPEVINAMASVQQGAPVGENAGS